MIVPMPIRDRAETPRPPVRRFRFALKTRWRIVTIRDNTTWAQRWHNLVYLVRG